MYIKRKRRLSRTQKTNSTHIWNFLSLQIQYYYLEAAYKKLTSRCIWNSNRSWYWYCGKDRVRGKGCGNNVEGSREFESHCCTKSKSLKSNVISSTHPATPICDCPRGVVGPSGNSFSTRRSINDGWMLESSSKSWLEMGPSWKWHDLNTKNTPELMLR